MLKNKIEKKIIKKNDQSQHGLTRLTCDLGHEIKINLSKANKKDNVEG
jgi:hypothetical protein